MKIRTLKFLRQRKFLLRLPLMVLPFILLIFFLLGGGRGSAMGGQKNPLTTGLNFRLPDAHFAPGKEKDKWTSYESQIKDSSKIWEAIKNDPYYHMLDSQSGGITSGTHEEKLVSKLAEIRAAVNQKKQPNLTPENQKTDAGAAISQFQKMMSEKKIQNSRDPEMERLNGMLDKLIAIQHPESAHENPKTPSYSVEIKPDQNDLTEWNGEKIKDSDYFFELEENRKPEDHHSRIPEAVIPETQSIVTGATIKLRLKNEVIIHGLMLPSGQNIYGLASVSNERLHIHISSIRRDDVILPVSLDVYDLDGQEGIYIPGSIPREVSKQSADQSISSLSPGVMDPSIGAQAASAGIQAAKTLFSKKLKLVKVSLPAGYQVLLKDSHQNNL